MATEKRIIEISGVKMEVDFRTGTSTKIEEFRVGSKVKLLKKNYGDTYDVKAGIIVGFDAFEKLPTIRILVISQGYGDGPIDVWSFNAETKDMEMLLVDEHDEELLLRKDQIHQTLERAVVTKELELEKAKEAVHLFHKYFGSKFAAEKVEA